MATTAQNPLPSSPTSSYDIISRSSGSVDSDDDEIVWSPSSGFLSGSESSNYLFSEDDFVVLSHSRSSSTAPRPDTEATTELASELALKLSVGPKVTHGHSQRGGRGHQKKQSQPPACPAPTSTASAIVDTNQTFTGLGSRSIVDDFSESASIADSDLSHTMYEDAVEYISSFLSNPSSDSANRLTFLQSLIIELGLATPSLPASLTSARALLKSRAFVNIRQYLAVRGEGLAAIQNAMYPSRSALIKDIKRNKQRTSLKLVKQNGLQVLLVQCYH